MKNVSYLALEAKMIEKINKNGGYPNGNDVYVSERSLKKSTLFLRNVGK